MLKRIEMDPSAVRSTRWSKSDFDSPRWTTRKRKTRSGPSGSAQLLADTEPFKAIEQVAGVLAKHCLVGFEQFL